MEALVPGPGQDARRQVMSTDDSGAREEVTSDTERHTQCALGVGWKKSISGYKDLGHFMAVKTRVRDLL